MIRLGITGGIGAGKSYVARLLEARYGVPVYDCDREARRLMVSDDALRTSISALVGPDAYAPDGSLCRPVVARFLFGSREHVRQLNALVHPAVRIDAEAWFQSQARQSHPPRLAAIESAILLEAGFQDIVEQLLVVTAPEPLRIQRACARDHVDEEQVRARIAAQLSDEERLRHATLVIHNDGTDLESQLQAMMDKLGSVT